MCLHALQSEWIQSYFRFWILNMIFKLWNRYADSHIHLHALYIFQANLQWMHSRHVEIFLNLIEKIDSSIYMAGFFFLLIGIFKVETTPFNRNCIQNELNWLIEMSDWPINQITNRLFEIYPMQYSIISIKIHYNNFIDTFQFWMN